MVRYLPNVIDSMKDKSREFSVRRAEAKAKLRYWERAIVNHEKKIEKGKAMIEELKKEIDELGETFRVWAIKYAKPKPQKTHHKTKTMKRMVASAPVSDNDSESEGEK